jgi:hypothetical protein
MHRQPSQKADDIGARLDTIPLVVPMHDGVPK